MAKSLTFVLLCIAGVADSARQQSNAGVQKVIQMLNDMSAECKKEKQDEEVAFAGFKTWCSTESATLKKDISKNAEQIELLTASIEKLTSDAKGLGEDIATLNTDVASWDADKKAATAQREKDHADFVEESTDYGESVDALDRAITVLQKQDYDRTGAETALLQVSQNDKVPEQVKSIVATFMEMMDGDKADQSGPDLDSYDAPEANAYDFQSGSIVDLLKKLKGEFDTKLGECQKEEMNSKHAYDMVHQDLVDSIENANRNIDEKKTEKERKTAKAAANKKQLAAEIEVKAANEKTLSETTAECQQKKLSFEEKQQLRADEIEAIAKAVEILASPDVAGNAEKHLDLAQAQTRPVTSLVSVGSSLRSGGIRRKVREFLADAGDKLHSQKLSLLAQKIASDPFAKVKSLIDSMITRLLEEANADADHEGYCDTEMGKSKITRNKLGEEIDSLAAAVEEGKATIMSLSEDIKELTKEVAEIVAGVTEATELRNAEKAKNKQTIKDAKQAQEAVAAATKVLKDFYAQAGEATGFLQTANRIDPPVQSIIKMGSDEWEQLANPNFQGTVDKGHKEGMQKFGGETYKGKQDQAGGVLALLEVIMSDFGNVQADTEADEESSQKEFDGFMVDSKKNKKVKERKIEMSTTDKAAAESRLREDISDLKSTQDQLLAADRYHEKLVPQCIDQGQTFEERTAAREAEIKSLKEALEILSSEDIA